MIVPPRWRRSVWIDSGTTPRTSESNNSRQRQRSLGMAKKQSPGTSPPSSLLPGFQHLIPSSAAAPLSAHVRPLFLPDLVQAAARNKQIDARRRDLAHPAFQKWAKDLKGGILQQLSETQVEQDFNQRIYWCRIYWCPDLLVSVLFSTKTELTPKASATKTELTPKASATKTELTPKASAKGFPIGGVVSREVRRTEEGFYGVIIAVKDVKE